jgi:Na+/proline symporter
VIAGGCYFLGGFGRVFYQNPNVGGDPSYDAIIPSMLSTLSPFLLGIVVILVLSASMSTLSSLVMASASTLTLDFIRGTVNKNMDEKKQLLNIRILIVVFIVLSVVLAILQYKIGFAFIAQLMGISWGALAGSFLAPFLYGLYWRKATKAACWVNFIFASGL